MKRRQLALLEAAELQALKAERLRTRLQLGRQEESYLARRLEQVRHPLVEMPPPPPEPLSRAPRVWEGEPPQTEHPLMQVQDPRPPELLQERSTMEVAQELLGLSITQPSSPSLPS